MAVELFSHNEEAYNSVRDLLEKAGRAAVIHPTGTGKSFIAFKLCEDFPERTVLWLSPSEYIFRTQLENLRKAAGGYEPDNIRFVTYARLMNLSREEVEELLPDVIVLDEFHRCGASQWGAGVQRLLEAYPESRVLGLSATAVRYLDGQRNMADELFSGCIASEITLGEAVVRGILNPPKYVLSHFSYQKDLENYEYRMRRVKNPAVRDAAWKYLEALRRALEKADGLDEIFARHMEDRHGKYLVFCANREHLREMAAKAAEWFGRVDEQPHIYFVYSEDPTTSAAFAAFKRDDSEHLKLLYCIDMLNEGIHLDDISGVILLRPTVSPIIYKQQIGRALSANKKNCAVIFDVVLNIENLYSIGAVEEEMQTAVMYYRALGLDHEIVREHFRIVDEVKDCLMLFDRLNEVLSAPWEVMYEQAFHYYKENGNLEVPARYLTADGYALGRWIYNQRNVRKGIQEGRLTEEQIAKLDAIGMRWELCSDIGWERNFAAAQVYYQENGDLDVPSRYVSESGVSLGLWLCTLRTWEKAGVHAKYLTEERKKKLEEIGMIWDKLDHFWERSFSAAYRYYQENGDLKVPSGYVTKEGIRLGAWIARQRSLRAGRLKHGTPPDEEQIARLDAIGMIWDKSVDSKWEKGYAAAVAYRIAHGDLNVSGDYRAPGGLVLKSWLQNQRKRYRSGRLEADRKKRLDAIGMLWELPDPWLVRYEVLLRYYRDHKTFDIPQNVVAEGVWIGKWLAKQREYLKEGKLSGEQAEKILRLEEGFYFPGEIMPSARKGS
ncbi:MAG: DEAD/DEAH box helicase family protein [Lachnospiraceae bacterium]|nr:DEAD/DEAH box helicase family protein [Lachnospiraceae bacterium]